jgi:hypothetical protein
MLGVHIENCTLGEAQLSGPEEEENEESGEKDIS